MDESDLKVARMTSYDRKGEKYFEQHFTPNVSQEKGKIRMSWDHAYVCALQMDVTTIDDEYQDVLVKSIGQANSKVTLCAFHLKRCSQYKR